MAILSAFNWEAVEVIGLTTLFGNVPTAMATKNALIIRELAAVHDPSKSTLPVVEGSALSFSGLEKHRIADFVHGKDGLGNQDFPEPQVRLLHLISSQSRLITRTHAHRTAGQENKVCRKQLWNL